MRFISNRSSGRLGTVVAEEAIFQGAEVTLVAGPGSQRPSIKDMGEGNAEKLEIIDIETVSDLYNVLESRLKSRHSCGYDAIIHAMAVLDYDPVEALNGKVKSGRDCWKLELKKTPKIISQLKKWAPDIILVGFKLETGISEEGLVAAASELIGKNNADLAVANDLTRIDGPMHQALLIDKRGEIIARPQTKKMIAQALCNFLAE